MVSNFTNAESGGVKLQNAIGDKSELETYGISEQPILNNLEMMVKKLGLSLEKKFDKKNENIQAELDTWKSRFMSSEARMKNMEKSFKETTANGKRLGELLDETLTQNEVIKRELRKLKEELVFYQRRIEKYEEEIGMFKEELNQSRTKSKSDESCIKDLLEKVDKYEEDLKRLTEENEKLKQQQDLSKNDIEILVKAKLKLQNKYCEMKNANKKMKEFEEGLKELFTFRKTRVLLAKK